jgi:TetR/AcrR family transcriptional regulator
MPIAPRKPELISPTRRPRVSDGTRDPDRTRRNLLDAAYREFADAGFHGTSIEQICRRAGVSKQILSHHFGTKENVYLTVLEHAYEASRAHDPALDLTQLTPREAMRELVCFAFDHLRANRAFVSLLTDENLLKGRHIRRSTKLRDSYVPLIEKISEILRKGEAEGVFRHGIDACQLYISISGLCFFYFSNAYTLTAALDRLLLNPEALDARRAHVLDFVMAAIAAPDTKAD